MRDRTLLLLLVLGILVAAYGWSVLAALFWVFFTLVLVLVLLAAFAIWRIRRNTRRVLTAWQRTMGDAFQEPSPPTRTPDGKAIIDVEPTEVRDAPDDQGRKKRP
jgi:hypothetical protein